MDRANNHDFTVGVAILRRRNTKRARGSNIRRYKRIGRLRSSKSEGCIMDWSIKFSDMLKILGAVIAVIYTVIRIEVTTERLTHSIHSLTETVSRVDSVVTRLDRAMIQREHDIQRLQDRVSKIDKEVR